MLTEKNLLIGLLKNLQSKRKTWELNVQVLGHMQPQQSKTTLTQSMKAHPQFTISVFNNSLTVPTNGMMDAIMVGQGTVLPISRPKILAKSQNIHTLV